MAEPSQNLPGTAVDLAHARDLEGFLSHVGLVDAQLVGPYQPRAAIPEDQWVERDGPVPASRRIHSLQVANGPQRMPETRGDGDRRGMPVELDGSAVACIPPDV